MKAVDHPHVRDVWAKKYPVDMWDQVPAAGANKTMAIFEMLTGYEVEPKSKSDYSDAKALMDDLKGSSLEPGMESGKGIDANPTIIYDQDGGMRPLIWNLEGDSSNFTAADFPVRLLDCRNAGTMNKTWIQQLEAKRYYAQYRNNTAYTGDLEAHDRFKSEQTLFDDMSWIVRLADKRSLNFTEGIENIKPDAATFGSYFYENVMPMKYYSNMDNTTLNISESNTQAPNNTDASNITITGYNTEAKNTTDGGNATANGEQSPDTSGGQ
ncbi:hypothetical protein QFC19_007794 [Naganishia cerealis]|uniref:Uncharacterized protein n=1 Tax=Naganishia cerealis TaxID=610337 RepID=A0ACC2V6X0_9TREE|nr:hypothetical protein QFC19_007794 [Naganishia cerealis]